MEKRRVKVKERVKTLEGVQVGIKAPRGSTITCKSWQTEAALRMLMNNLDPEVAEKPAELIVYGGAGKGGSKLGSLSSNREMPEEPRKR